MREERVEIRTPQENILLCALCEKSGHSYAEVKRKNKSDFLDLDNLIYILTEYKKQMNM